MGADLSIRGVSVVREETTVVQEVDLECPAGEVTVLLGSNGAGKTSLLDAVAGVCRIARGTVILGGAEIQQHGRDTRARLGLSYVEQGRTIFGALSVEENLEVVAKRGTTIDRVFDVFPELAKRRKVAAQMISGGEQQMLVLGRAMLQNPAMLLIDEMSQGLAPVAVKRLMPVVGEIARGGTSVLLVEQFAGMALRIGTRAYVMSVGRISLEGPCRDLLEHPDDVKRAYLSGERITVAC